jgi:hypothetical protein
MELGLGRFQLDSKLRAVLLSDGNKHLEAVETEGCQHNIICLSYG